MDHIVGKNRDVHEIQKMGYAEQKEKNRQMLRAILSSICFPGRQGLALCGQYMDNKGVSMAPIFYNS